MKYLVIVEKGDTGYGAYVPDLPGCIAVAETEDEVLELIEEAIEFHLEGLKEEGLPMPSIHSAVRYVDIQPA
ncbi:MAG: type II toxin-antitoxin system HicB family antitoxin [Acidobacteria bacterium]|nr:type II toxin-antitoxin system HicB family antitoxin [Acidobacteriota bacterium]